MIFVDVTEVDNTLDYVIDDTIPNKVYHKMKGVSSTSLKSMEKSYKVFENRHLFHSDSPALAKGSLWHTGVLEPHLLNDEYIEAETISTDTLNAKQLRAENPNLTVVGNGMIEDARIMGDKVRVIYGDVLNSCRKEVSIIAQDKVYGVQRKCRPDAWDENAGIVIDVKTTSEWSVFGFQKKVEQMDYHVQAAWYMDTMELAGVKPKVMALIVIPTGNCEPFGFFFSDELLQKGREKYQALLEGYKAYREDGYDKLFKEIFSWEFIKEQKGL